MSFFTVRLTEEGVELLDQRLLPGETRVLLLKTGEEVAQAIEQMAVRGAPAIGVTAAMGVAIEVSRAVDSDLRAALSRACARLRNTRPTAINLAWALDLVEGRLGELIDRGVPAAEVRAEATALARRICDDDVETCRRIGDAGLAIVPDAARILTHCNAGALATAGYGTALGVIRSAAREGRVRRVIASETRPFLQGARLTAWELLQDGIPTALITDSMAGALMQQGEVDLVIVGADRIAANGDVANKIGTYGLAVLARAHEVPFYVAAPLSTVDLETAVGDEIPIEQRPAEELVTIAGRRIAPEGVEVLHPAFDVTPASLVSGLITEAGLLGPPFGPELERLKHA